MSHVTGESVFINDMPVNDRLLTGHVFYSRIAHGRILSLDITEALKVEGVHAILTARDIPGENQMGPVVKDEPILAETEVTFIGQAIALIAAENEEAARKAEKLIRLEMEPLEAILDIEAAIARNNKISGIKPITRGNAMEAMEKAPHRLRGELRTGAQEHWYLETQTALAIPGEGKELQFFASTQHPAETQAIVANALGIQKNDVEVEVRRLGGAFGGKETQGNHVAAWASLLAHATGRPVKIHLFRDDDQVMTGKRHRFLSRYEIGFDEEGKILAYIVELNADAGSSTDLSRAIMARAVMHAENACYVPDISITGNIWKTNLPSNTAFRGFGGPQGMAVIENAIDRVARYLKKDPAEIRFLNFYSEENGNITPYGETVKNNYLQVMYEKLVKSSSYFERRKEIDQFNHSHEFLKRGIALTPVKFGISFNTTFLNQAGALVNIYNDGSVQVNHGGIEMGQGLYEKIRKIASRELGIDPDWIRINATSTSKVPNTSATAASSGSDMNGMAVRNAIGTLKSRLAEVSANLIREKDPGSKISSGELIFDNNFIYDPSDPEKKISFPDAVKAAYHERVSLSATGFYKTPDIFFNNDTNKGAPFYYYSFGMAVSEVLIDVLTGQHKLLRTDIIQDAGDSIDEEIDKGQILGGFIQGVGWCTTEEIKWDQNGRLLTHSPDTYKIPTVNDIPGEIRVEIMKNVPNPGTIHHSKAIGEPPFMLAFSVWLAIKDAISAVGNHSREPGFALPATGEVILLSCHNQLNKDGI